MDDSPNSDGINGAGDDLSVAMEIACRHGDRLLRTHCSEFYAGQNHANIGAGLSFSRSLVFKMKKLQNGGEVDAIGKWQKEAILAE